MPTQVVIFSAPKVGYQPAEWEDGGGYGPEGSTLRFAVADGATEGYESRRWVRQLLRSFLSDGTRDTRPGPRLDQDSFARWLTRMQDEWSASVPSTSDYIDLMKIKDGALATFVGCELDGLDTSSPRWRAVAAGDAVLFHVRDNRLRRHLPPLSAADFGTTPSGLRSQPAQLAKVVSQLQFDSGRLAAGDLLFAATDAIAKWMLTWVEKDEETLWRSLAALARQDDFEKLVSQYRQVKDMKDDDVTLLRLRLLPRAAETLVVWQ